MNQAISLAIDLTERGLMPEPLVRRGMRRLIKQRLSTIDVRNCESVALHRSAFANDMARACVAPLPEKANEQHYEVPPEFFRLVLGKHAKYSACFWGNGIRNLDDAEEAALAITAERAELTDGQKILELGCGWGSLTLWMAAQLPNARITAVSNSAPQRAYIEQQLRSRELTNVEVITADMNDFAPRDSFDRVVSVEMFEHMRNYPELFKRISTWLNPGGRFFMHIFCHRDAPYAFDVEDDSDWMSAYFFSGGIMPSDDLPLRFQEDLRLVDQWRWSGTHYQKTAAAWLANMEARRDEVMQILRDVYGAEDATRWWYRWRLFFAACEELFGFNQGQEWWVSHYLFTRR